MSGVLRSPDRTDSLNTSIAGIKMTNIVAASPETGTVISEDLHSALAEVFDLAGLEVSDGQISWYAEPIGLEEKYPGLPGAIYELAQATLGSPRPADS